MHSAKWLMSFLWGYLDFVFFFFCKKSETEFCLTSQSRCRHTHPAGRFCLLFAGRRSPQLHKTLWSRLPGRRCQEESFCSLLLFLLFFFIRPPCKFCQQTFHPLQFCLSSQRRPLVSLFLCTSMKWNAVFQVFACRPLKRNVGFGLVLSCATYSGCMFMSPPHVLFFVLLKLPTRKRGKPSMLVCPGCLPAPLVERWPFSTRNKFANVFLNRIRRSKLADYPQSRSQTFDCSCPSESITYFKMRRVLIMLAVAGLGLLRQLWQACLGFFLCVANTKCYRPYPVSLQACQNAGFQQENLQVSQSTSDRLVCSHKSAHANTHRHTRLEQCAPPRPLWAPFTMSNLRLLVELPGRKYLPGGFDRTLDLATAHKAKISASIGRVGNCRPGLLPLRWRSLFSFVCRL